MFNKNGMIGKSQKILNIKHRNRKLNRKPRTLSLSPYYVITINMYSDSRQ